MTTVDTYPTHAALVDQHGLVLLAQAAWPAADSKTDTPPPVAGFVGSTFHSLVVEVAARCLAAAGHPAPGSGDQAPVVAARIAILIVSVSGDLATADLVATAVDRNERVWPLLFFASVPNAVAGYVASRWGLRGPVVCLGPAGDAVADGLWEASLLIRDGDADLALIVEVEQGDAPGVADRASALLVRAREAGTNDMRGARS